jgi:hypothetical protein
MTYVFLGGLGLLLAIALFNQARKLPSRIWRRGLRWGLGGAAALLAVVFVIVRRIDLAVFAAAGAVSILARGRLGPFSFEPSEIEADNTSKVRSRYFVMTLDHDTGTIAGDVVSGQFAGADLIDLGEAETRALIEEIQGDADSVSLLETWLDTNRCGWREYFEEAASGGGAGTSSSAGGADPISEAYAVLGLSPGATKAEIRAAHRELMKGVHPDHGGSSYLASKINEARDVLLERAPD